MRERLLIHPCNLEKRKLQLARWKIPESTRREILQFLNELALGKVNRGRKISDRRQLKYIEMLRIPMLFFNKATPRLTVPDVERFEKALATGHIASSRFHRPYGQSTQSDIRKALRTFLRWRLGQAKALELAGWLDTRCRPKTPDFLSEAQVERLYKACSRPEQRFLIAVLFDSGARAEEFHNLRIEDIHLPEGQDNFVRIALKEEYSKTLGRTIALYWKNSLEAVQEYLRQRREQGAKPGEPVFAANYPAAKKFIQRLGQRVLGRNIYYHLFRHSSATYYATKLNRQELCYRYGWKFSSNMPDIYISRAGMETRQLDEKFTQTELSAVKADVIQLEQASKIKDERIKQLEEAGQIKDQRLQELEQAMQTIRENMETFAKVLSLNPKVEEIEATFRKKQARR